MTTKPHDLLKAQRLAKGRTQQEMADGMGMDKATYCNMENGKRRYLVEDAILASEFLGVSFVSVTIKPSRAQREAA
jgi:transcriptional regulator with XRE-family HTH domain